jgi:hypothetical protein
MEGRCSGQGAAFVLATLVALFEQVIFEREESTQSGSRSCSPSNVTFLLP